MAELGLEGDIRGRRRTTVPEPSAPRPPDLVDRDFTASRPDQLWVADMTYVRTWSGWAYVAFVLDVYIGLLGAASPIPVAAALGHAYRLEGCSFISLAYGFTLLAATFGVGRILVRLGMQVSGFSDESASTEANDGVATLVLAGLLYGFLFAVAALSPRRMWVLSDVGWAVTAWFFT